MTLRPLRVPRIAALLAALVVASCRRDIAVPPPSTFALVDAFPSAAPRETLTITATGGSRPYAFAFAPGGPGSGPGATIDPVSGAYQAGADGPALDVVEARDATGAMREVQITVGPRLQVTPGSAFVAPSGRVSFVATGGKPPYTLEIVSGPGSVLATDYLAAASGGCSGSVTAPANAVLRLRDATSTPPISLQVSVGRGLDLFPAAGNGSVAPYEQIALVASGGQPPYEFSMAAAPSGGKVEAGRGVYGAGANGNVVDRVVVVDANHEQRCFDVPVGPPLTVALSTADVRPGIPLRLLASGGRPPYTFGFARKGNRSHGAIEPVTGEYVPGLNALATDLLYVKDSTDAPAVGPIAIHVGPMEVVTGDGNWGCTTARLKGDDPPDALLFGYMGSVKTVLTSAMGDVATVAEYPVLGEVLVPPASLHLNRDDLTDVAYVSPTGLRTLLAQPGGALVEGPSYPNAPLAIAVAQGSSQIFAVVNGSAACGVSGKSIVRLDHAAGSEVFTETCVAPLEPGWRQGSLAAGDFDGDGITDVAYGVGGAVAFRLSGSVPPYATPATFPLPAPWVALRFSGQEVHPWLEVRPDGAPASDLVVVVIDSLDILGEFQTALAVFGGGAGGPALKQIRVTKPGGAYNLMAVSPVGMEVGGRPQLVATNVSDGAAEILDYDRTSATPLSKAAAQLPARPFRIGSVCGGDFDGDGVQDLLVAPRNGVGARAELLVGEGDGTYARRPRFASTATPYYANAYGMGDVDGDGAVDLLAPTVGGGLEVVFYADGQLAFSGETPVPGQFLSAMAADWDGDGNADLMIRSGSTGFEFYKGLPSRDGSFAAPVPVHVTDVTGAPYDYAAVFQLKGRFGGASAGPGLDGIVRYGALFRHVVLMFDDATHAVAALPPIGGYGYPVVADVDGDGFDDLVDLDTSAGTPAVSLVRRGDPVGPSWPFRPWVSVGPVLMAPVSVGAVPVPGTARVRAVYLDADRIVLVDAPGGTPSVVEVLLSSPVVDWSNAAVARVDGDPYPDLVVAQPAPDPWLVFPGTADGSFAATPRADLTFTFGMGFSGASPYFMPVSGASGQDDLVVTAGNRLIVLHNDGTGHFE